MDRTQFFDALWARYVEVTPQALAIQSGLTARGETVVNDHVALRSLAKTGFDLDSIEARLTAIGYVRLDTYVFSDKHLDARAYCCLEDPEAPKIFVSTLRRGVFSAPAEAILDRLASALDTMPCRLETLTQGATWPAITFDEFQLLAAESEYAGWLAVWGLQANHFTVSVNHLQGFSSLSEVNAWLTQSGYRLNQSGGEIKGSAAVLLAQSATLADQVTVRFGCGRVVPISSCFYEFAERFVDAEGRLFQGFVAANADHIFNSTNRQLT